MIQESIQNTRPIKYLVVHCTAGNQKESIDDLLAGFRARGWKNPGYHYVVQADGNVVQLFPESLVANGVLGFNKNSIHISYLGGIDNTGKPVDNRTPHQKNALAVSLKILKQKYPGAVIMGHRDFSKDTNGNGKIDVWEYIKYCPCFDAMIEYAGIK
ncbi:MAG: N-acetylmuramoyl-L-alanine amidase [Chitinophagaceae bacterium]